MTQYKIEDGKIAVTTRIDADLCRSVPTKDGGRVDMWAARPPNLFLISYMFPHKFDAQHWNCAYNQEIAEKLFNNLLDIHNEDLE